MDDLPHPPSPQMVMEIGTAGCWPWEDMVSDDDGGGGAEEAIFWRGFSRGQARMLDAEHTRSRLLPRLNNRRRQPSMPKKKRKIIIIINRNKNSKCPVTLVNSHAQRKQNLCMVPKAPRPKGGSRWQSMQRPFLGKSCPPGRGRKTQHRDPVSLPATE